MLEVNQDKPELSKVPRAETESSPESSLDELFDQAIEAEEKRTKEEKASVEARAQNFKETLLGRIPDLPTAVATEAQTIIDEAKAEIEKNNQALTEVFNAAEAAFFEAGEEIGKEGPLPDKINEVEPTMAEAETRAAAAGEPLISEAETERLARKATIQSKQAEKISAEEETTKPAETKTETTVKVESFDQTPETPKSKDELFHERQMLQRKWEELANQFVEKKMTKEEIKKQQKLLKGKLPFVERQKMINDLGFTAEEYTAMKHGGQAWTLNAIWKRLGEIDRELSSLKSAERPRAKMAKETKVLPKIKEEQGIPTGERGAVPSYESYETIDETTEPSLMEAEKRAQAAGEPKISEAEADRLAKELQEKEEKSQKLAELKKQWGEALRQKAKIRRAKGKERAVAENELKKINNKIKKLRAESKKIIS